MAEKQNTPEIRFEGFTDPWEQRKLGDVSKKVTTKNTDGALNETFTNSAERGIVSQLDYFDHDITNEANVNGYYVVRPNDFVYNPRISTIAPCGPINRNRLNRAGVMSPLYTVFSIDDGVCKTYLEHYFKTSRWHDFMFLEGNSGARSDRFSISDSLFFEMPIWCPSLTEQEAIAQQLELTDNLITLHQRKYQYRGLYGYLSWEQRKLEEVALVTMGQSPNGACYTDNPNDAVLVQGNADLKDGWVSPRVWTTEITKTAKAGDLIMSVRAPVGAMGKTAYDVVLGRGVAGIAGNEFLFQALSKKEAEGYWSTVSAGSTFDSINGDELRNTLVDCPCSELECETIGDCLSKVDSLITLHQRKLELLRNIKKSLLDRMFV